MEEMAREMPALLCSGDWRAGRWMVGGQSFGHTSVSFNQPVDQSSGNRVCQPRGGSVSWPLSYSAQVVILVILEEDKTEHESQRKSHDLFLSFFCLILVRFVSAAGGTE